jgi:ABC-2 type transport system ATP-binding protein
MSPTAAVASERPATLSTAVLAALPVEGSPAAPTPATAPLVLTGLTVRYGDRTAVAGVSLELREGEVHALLGRNGAGKSSLVRCLLGQQRPTAGRALIFGRDVWRQRAALMAEVGVVMEQPDAPPHASARQLAGLCRPLYRRWDSHGFDHRLRRFAVPADVPFDHLSKGQQRQVALALALAAGPRLLILDDPTLGLDVVARRAFFDELIGDLADRGTTVLLATHELAAVERIADRVAILAGGRLLLDEPMEGLKQRCRRLTLAPGPAAASAGDAAAPPAPPAGFTPLHRETHAWGTEIVVADFDEERFRRWQVDSAAAAPPAGAAAPSVEVATLTLEEIFLTLAGAPDAGPEPGDTGRQRDHS